MAMSLLSMELHGPCMGLREKAIGKTTSRKLFKHLAQLKTQFWPFLRWKKMSKILNSKTMLEMWPQRLGKKHDGAKSTLHIVYNLTEKIPVTFGRGVETDLMAWTFIIQESEKKTSHQIKPKKMSKGLMSKE